MFKRRGMAPFKKIKSLFLRFERFITSKRQRLVISVFILSFLLFLIEHFLGKLAFYVMFVLAVFTDVLLFLSLRKDLKDNFSWQIFILPFFFSLAFGLFYLLAPGRLLTRLVMTSLYAIGLYSLFLSENIFTVSSMRTIALLSGARTVAFTITLVSFFFLSNVVFSLHLNVVVTLGLIFAFTFPLILQSLWMHTLEKKLSSEISWVLFLTACLFELSVLLWFWPSTPTLIALFLTGVFYTIVGISQVWFDKRLFKAVIWEYVLVSIIVFTVLVLYTPWS